MITVTEPTAVTEPFETAWRQSPDAVSMSLDSKGVDAE
jgi:hypothetical protein